jgi:hypothetical protein
MRNNSEVIAVDDDIPAVTDGVFPNVSKNSRAEVRAQAVDPKLGSGDADTAAVTPTECRGVDLSAGSDGSASAFHVNIATASDCTLAHVGEDSGALCGEAVGVNAKPTGGHVDVAGVAVTIGNRIDLATAGNCQEIASDVDGPPWPMACE